MNAHMLPHRVLINCTFFQRIMFDTVDGVDLSKYFTTQPTRGTLYPGEKPTSVFTVFKADQEITIKDQPVLKCQVRYVHTCCVVSHVLSA